MSSCYICKSADTAFHFPVLQVQTLKLREMKGERWIQALGDKAEYSVCRKCAAKRLKDSTSPVMRIFKKCIPFIALVVIGILTTIFLFNETMITFKLLGPASIIVGIISIITVALAELKEGKALQAQSGEDAIRQAAWLLLLEKLPKKDGDNDLSYVPINKKTKGMQPKALALEYDLLMTNAKKAANIIKTS